MVCLIARRTTDEGGFDLRRHLRGLAADRRNKVQSSRVGSLVICQNYLSKILFADFARTGRQAKRVKRHVVDPVIFGPYLAVIRCSHVIQVSVDSWAAFELPGPQ